MNIPAMPNNPEILMVTLAKLASVAPPEKPSVQTILTETAEGYMLFIPKNIPVAAVRESNTDKKTLFVSAVPKSDKTGAVTVTLNVTEGDASTPVRFRLGAMNLFVANK